MAAVNSSCIHLNACNILHNSVRDCFAGAARKCIATDPDAQVSYIFADKHAKSATWMHDIYPFKLDAPTIIIRDDPLRRPAPSLSPDILIAFVNDPLDPYFGDFWRLSNKLKRREVAQLRYCSKPHQFPTECATPLLLRDRDIYTLPLMTSFHDAIPHNHSPQLLSSCDLLSLLRSPLQLLLATFSKSTL